MSSEQSSFCALRSRKNQECIYGTVARVDSWLLLEYPGAWFRNAVEESALPPEVLAQLGAFRSADPRHRQLLVRQAYDCRGPFRCLIVRSCERNPRIIETRVAGYCDLVGGTIEELEAGGVAHARPLYAVCTHGRHDKCCSKFGFPVYRALREMAGDRVWQCSHMGGDRFAANVVVFPWGLYYGRLTGDDLQTLVERTERGEVFLERYRGRCCVPRAAQVAEYFARSESGRMGISEFELAGRVQRDDARTLVRLRAASDATLHEVEYRTHPAELMEYLTCTAETPSPIAQYKLLGYAVSR